MRLCGLAQGQLDVFVFAPPVYGDVEAGAAGLAFLVGDFNVLNYYHSAFGLCGHLVGYVEVERFHLPVIEPYLEVEGVGACGGACLVELVGVVGHAERAHAGLRAVGLQGAVEEYGGGFGRRAPGVANDEIVEYAKKLQEKGARNVLVSMAGDGAILITEEGEVHVTPCPKGEVKNSVGAGDSMVAGFITGYLRSNGDYNEALKMGTAAGSATAFSEDVATGEKIMELYKTL